LATDNLETVDLEELAGMKEVKDVLNNESENLEIHSQLKIPRKLRSIFVGDIIDLDEGFAKSKFITNNEMVFDNFELIHSGFIFGAANFVALAAVNYPYVVLVTSNVKFIAPIELGNEIEFEANVIHKYARKREVNVIGRVSDVKVFEGLFLTVVLDKHILSLKLIRKKEEDY